MPINMFTKTKVIATIGPSTNSYEKLKNLHKAGMNVVRINMSHANHEYAQAIDSKNTNYQNAVIGMAKGWSSGLPISV